MRRNREAGQTIVLFAFGLTALLVAAGLAIDMGFLRYQKRRMQAAADSAAIAGAAELRSSNWATAATTDTSYNGFANGTNGVTVTPSCPPSTGPYSAATCDTSDYASSTDSYVEVLISQPQPTFFMKIAGITSVAMTARAVAHLGSSQGCFYGLGQFNIATDSFGDVVHLDMDVPGCGIFDNSSLTLQSHTITARYVGCVGACTVAGEGSISPAPVTIAPATDPLSFLPTQTNPGTCTGMPYSIGNGMGTVGNPIPISPGFLSQNNSCGVTVTGSGVAELSPGNYPGPITISGYANVKFDPGTYVLGNGLSIQATTSNAGMQVTGTGVTFYNYNGSIDVCVAPILPVTGCLAPPGVGDPTANSVNLSAPTDASADYPGVLFFQDPTNPAAAMFNGNYLSTTSSNSYTTMQGVFYFPNPLSSLTLINLTSWTSFSGSLAVGPQPGYLIAVAKNLFVGGNIDVGSDYSGAIPGDLSLPNGTSPIMTAVLAE